MSRAEELLEQLSASTEQLNPEKARKGQGQMEVSHGFTTKILGTFDEHLGILNTFMGIFGESAPTHQKIGEVF